MAPVNIDALQTELSTLLGSEHVSVRESDKLVYSTDWSWMLQMWLDRGLKPTQPDIIVHPGSAQDVTEIMKLASRHKLPVVPWGGGSGSQGGAGPVFGGILLDMKRMNRIVEINENCLTVTAQAGINGTQLEWALNERGLTLPHYPASANCATLGGYLAPRGSGVISTKYGKAEELVLSLQVVLPNGDIIDTPLARNHASGPDFMGLWVGAEGTLGVITEATMQIERQPACRLLRGVLFEDLPQALEAGRRIMTQRLDPLVIRLYDLPSTKKMIKRVLDMELSGAYMALGFDGWPEIAEAQEKRALDICFDMGAKDLGRKPGEAWWENRYNFYFPPLSLFLPQMYGTTETVTTFDYIHDLYYAKKALIEEGYADWNATYIGHFSHWFPWGVMLYDRFVINNPPQDPQEALALHNEIWTRAVRTSLKHNGMLNEHHGIGFKLGYLMPELYGDPTWAFLSTLKNAIDPHGIMNPGKLGFPIVDGLTLPDSQEFWKTDSQSKAESMATF
ncbi:MAG: FAD-binding oxidoreductase [Anaerolineae bacterium]|nr:FAD-binding oxidoreductase [Anaerolineae bacterium]